MSNLGPQNQSTESEQKAILINILTNEAKYTSYKFLILQLIVHRRMWRSTFVWETILRRSIRLKQTDRTCWTIQTHSDELSWARRRTFHELKVAQLDFLGGTPPKFEHKLRRQK